MNIIIISLITFSITLLLTKSKILAGKRQFVEQRYLASKNSINAYDSFIVVWIHRVWRSFWTCAMCSGFWVACFVCCFFDNWFVNVIITFGVNWILHCIEDFFFQVSKLAEKIFQDLNGLSK